MSQYTIHGLINYCLMIDNHINVLLLLIANQCQIQYNILCFKFEIYRMSLATGLVRLRLVCDFNNMVCIGKQMCVRDLRIRLIN